MLEFEYARSALKNGLKMEAELGVNPYKFGLVGSTDAHTALATADDDNFFGKASNSEPSATRATHPWVKTEKATIMGWEQTASGYAAVWATENTREALFDAMKRKETYATTGPRMIVRFFGGWDFEEKDAQNRMPARIGYTKGVPMGGDLHAAPAGKSPTFLVAALKDPIGANLDRIQIIKGWLDKAGKTQEKVYDVVWSGDRKPGSDGKVPLVGNTVDVPDATYTNTIGAPELIKVWKDPDFDPALRAFYYVRVIEIPTPRWTAYDAKYFDVKMPPEVPMTTTERAYTSPIWYTPTDVNWTNNNQPKEQQHENYNRSKLIPRELGRLSLLVGLMAFSLAVRALAQDVDVDPKNVTLGKAEYCPYLDHAYPDRVYFGDTHLHTSYSTDAGMMGCRLGPDEAYRFARGEEVTSSTGVPRASAAPAGFPGCLRPLRESRLGPDDRRVQS